MGIAIPQVITNTSGAQVIDGSLKFDDNSSNYLSRTFASGGNRTTWTWSGWVKRTLITQNNTPLMSCTNGENDNDYLAIRFAPGSTPDALCMSSYGTNFRVTDAFFRDIGWYHFVVACDTSQSSNSDRFKVYVNGVLQTFGTESTITQNINLGFNQTAEHRIGRVDSSYFDGFMSQVYLIDGQALTPDSFGFTDPLTNTWKPKKYTRGVFEELDKFNTYTWGESQNQLRYQGIKFPSSAGGTVAWKATGASNTGLNLYTSTDNSNWTRRLTNQTVDSTNGLVYESSDQYVILVNGSDANWSNQLQLFSDVNGATIHYSNATYPGNGSPTMSWSGPGYTDGTIASYNSFYLPMDNEDDFEKDKSGNGNDWTKNNFSGTSNDPDVLPDSPSGISYSTDSSSGITTTSQIKPTNWATMNLLDKHPTSATEDGNLVVSNTSNLWCGIRGTFGRTSGKFYYEVKTGGAGSGGESVFIGLGSDNPLLVKTDTPQDDSTTMAAGTVLYCDDGQKILDSNTRSSYGTAISNQDLIGVAYDLDNKTVEFFNDGTSQGSIDFSSTVCGGANQIVFPYYISYYAATKSQFNFGQKPFKYAPPDGFRPLCDANARPDKVISRPNQYVGIITYNGNGGTQNVSFGSTISFDGIPDLVWIKHRTRNQAHVWYDSVRTAGTGKALASNSTGAEGGQSDGTTYGYLSEFTRNGFTVIDGSDAEDYVNKSGAEYVAWCWKAGGNKNTFNVDNVGYSTYTNAPGLNSGTIALTAASVGTKQGFSILKWTGTSANGTLSHGLTKSPEFVIVKKLTATGNWYCYHSGLTDATKYIWLNSANSENTQTAAWNSTDPTSSVLHLGGEGEMNANDNSSIAYLWHDVPGLQKFGTYIGNQNANGVYVELGFRPKLVWIKSVSVGGSGYNWYIHDSERNKFNPTKLDLRANEGREQTTTTRFDFLSNGFKIRGANLDMNDDGETFIYCAWAEAPSVDLFGGGANAR